MDTLDVSGAHLHYEVRGHGPLVVLTGAPSDADAFAAVADLLSTEYTVVTADPRGINRSRLDDPHGDSTPQLRADDLDRLITHLNAGPAIVVGCGGGAVTALALAQTHSGQVHTLIAHEPPLTTLLDDAEQLQAGTEDIISTHLGGDVIGTWKKLFIQSNITIPEAALRQMFGSERDPQQILDEHRFFAHEMRASFGWQPDIAALRSLTARIVIGTGEDSTGQLADRTANALARLLDTDPVSFPGGHTGYIEAPEGFAARLREILSSSLPDSANGPIS